VRIALKVATQEDGDFMDVILLYLMACQKLIVRGIILNSFLEKAVTILPGKINCGCVAKARPNPIS